ncbi:MAG: hypothetical protein ABIR96_06835 [Bdellovibrionota bacterium]
MSGEDKQKKLDRVAKSILSIVVRFGFENLSPSRLARAAQVSRPWVYKYIGGSKEALSGFAVEHFGKLLAQLDTVVKPTNIEFFRDDEIVRLENALNFAEQNPEIIAIYYRYKGTPTSLGKAIEKVENEYRQAKIYQIRETFKLSQSDAEIYTEILSSLKMGLCHKWISGDLKGKVPRDNYLKVVGSTFRNFFANL